MAVKLKVRGLTGMGMVFDCGSCSLAGMRA